MTMHSILELIRSGKVEEFLKGMAVLALLILAYTFLLYLTQHSN